MPPDPIDLALALQTSTFPSGAPLSPGLAHALASAKSTLEAALALYGPAIATAFNGGKDATVVLHLARAVLAHPLTCMYLIEPSAFPAVDAFVQESVARLELVAVAQDGGFKDGIRRFVDERGVKAFVMGTRRSDPYAGEMKGLEESSPGWPSFMRVNPILDWEYGHVWEFLRGFEIDYCCLYDEGYTSLGNLENTERNPALFVGEGEGSKKETAGGRYLPAWKLDCAKLERAGRGKQGVGASGP